VTFVFLTPVILAGVKRRPRPMGEQTPVGYNDRMAVNKITTPDHPAMGELCKSLAELAQSVDTTGDWPAEQLALCGEYGAYEWFLEPEWGGLDWDQESVMRGYLALSSACLTTTFIITQRTGACRRIASSTNEEIKRLLLPDLAKGSLFATVGVSHLTTSRRHLAQPVLRAHRAPGGFVFEGFSPWVTGAAQAEYVVTGATLVVDDCTTDEQLLVVVPTDLPGVSAPKPAELVGLTASHTGEMRFDGVFVDEKWVLAGPIENVMWHGVGAGAGGYQTSTLALGLSRAAIVFLEEEAKARDSLEAPLSAIREEYQQLCDALFGLVRGDSDCSAEQLRQRCNSLVLRSTQAAMAAAKGTGYVLGHPAGRWCREALFFLVWSCPQPVVSANLCEFAGIAE